MFFALFGFVGALFAVLGFFIDKRDKAYTNNSSVITGEVINIREQSVQTSEGARTRYLPVIKYLSQGSCYRFEGDDQGGTHLLKPGNSVRIRLQNDNHKIARLEADISSLGGIAYLFIGLGVVAVMFSLIMFDPTELKFDVMLFAPIVAILYVGLKLWPRIAMLRQLPMFEESESGTQAAKIN